MRRYVIAAVLLVTAGCSTVTSGRVVDKGYNPPYTDEQWVCAAYNSNGTMCTVNVPIYTEQPECWRLDLVNAGEHGSVCIPKAQWDYIRKGDRYGEKPE